MMRTITCLLVCLLIGSQLTIAQNGPAQDTSKKTPIDTADPKKKAEKPKEQPVKATNSADSANKKDTTAKSNKDSLSIVRGWEYQNDHPEYLYAHKKEHFWPSSLISLFLVVGLGLYLLWTTPLCRDQSYDPRTNQLRPIKERPYSYSRLQLFWWTIIIFWCFFSFFIYTGVLLAFTPTVVMLLGGGLAVSVFGKVMDNSQITANNKPVPTRHQDLEPSKDFLTDILSDDGGISIHRFQALLANLIFGIAFITNFLKALHQEAYPFTEFEPWQLTLLGVSAAGYLGLKANENGKPTETDRQIEAVASVPATAIVAPPPNVSLAAVQLKADLMAKGLTQ
jgi:hypothetical protein